MLALRLSLQQTDMCALFVGMNFDHECCCHGDWLILISGHACSGQFVVTHEL